MIALLFILGVCQAANIPVESMIKMQSKVSDLTAESSNLVQAALPVQSKYFLYNVLQVDPDRPLSAVAFPYGRPGNSYVTSSFNFYGTPIYDYEIQLSPVFPNIDIQSFVPNYIPQQPISTTTQRPPSFDEDKIEKLDEKVDPHLEMNLKNDESQEDDTVVVESV